MENKLAIEVAKNLLKIQAVFLKPNDPFTWASGIKSPIYCDNRLTLSYPETRRVVENGLAQIIKTYFPTCEVVMGTSTAGIAHAAYVSEILDMPMGYVRGGAKDHGRGNQIEGVVPVGKDVVVMEDLISTAGSSIEVVEVLREAGANVLGIASIFTYGLKKGIDRLAEANVINH
ncbi:MAG: orotate phosphoribosyltransferase, partial [Acholeplasmatales bacterium]|nr:orotate phosphoribosyltransferase [Acholeplasmatales bacterium]